MNDKKVMIREHFEKDWRVLTFNNDAVVDFQIAIKLIKASGLKNVELKQQIGEGCSSEQWDNF